MPTVAEARAELITTYTALAVASGLTVPDLVTDFDGLIAQVRAEEQAMPAISELVAIASRALDRTPAENAVIARWTT